MNRNTLPLFSTNEDEKKILRKLELYLIKNPTTDSFFHLTQLLYSVGLFSREHILIRDLRNKLYIALNKNELMYHRFTTDSVTARIYINYLLNTHFEWVAYGR